MNKQQNAIRNGENEKESGKKRRHSKITETIMCQVYENKVRKSALRLLLTVRNEWATWQWNEAKLTTITAAMAQKNLRINCTVMHFIRKTMHQSIVKWSPPPPVPECSYRIQLILIESQTTCVCVHKSNQQKQVINSKVDNHIWRYFLCCSTC